MGETLNHLKEEHGLTHNDTVLLTIFVAVRTYLKLPLPFRFITRIREFEASEFVGMEGWARKDGEVYRDNGKDGRVERNRKDCGKALHVNTGCSFGA